METKYKVGYYDDKGKRKYDIVSSQEAVIALVASKLSDSVQITIRRISSFTLE